MKEPITHNVYVSYNLPKLDAYLLANKRINYLSKPESRKELIINVHDMKPYSETYKYVLTAFVVDRLGVKLEKSDLNTMFTGVVKKKEGYANGISAKESLITMLGEWMDQEKKISKDFSTQRNINLIYSHLLPGFQGFKTISIRGAILSDAIMFTQHTFSKSKKLLPSSLEYQFHRENDCPSQELEIQGQSIMRKILNSSEVILMDQLTLDYLKSKLK